MAQWVSVPDPSLKVSNLKTVPSPTKQILGLKPTLVIPGNLSTIKLGTLTTIKPLSRTVTLGSKPTGISIGSKNLVTMGPGAETSGLVSVDNTGQQVVASVKDFSQVDKITNGICQGCPSSCSSVTLIMNAFKADPAVDDAKIQTFLDSLIAENACVAGLFGKTPPAEAAPTGMSDSTKNLLLYGGIAAAVLIVGAVVLSKKD